MASLGYGVDDGIILVTADPSNMTITQGGATLDLTLPPGYTVTGWYINGVPAAALGTSASVSLDPDDYAVKAHRVAVLASKDGRPYSWQSAFTVQAGGGGTPLDLSGFLAELDGLVSNNTGNTPETAVPLALDATVDLTDSTTTSAIFNKLKTLSDKYIVLDLSNQTFTSFNPDTYTPSGLSGILTGNWIVDIKLPPMLETIGDELFVNSITAKADGLRSITIPASVTYIGYNAFWYCENLARVIFEGNVGSIGSHAFNPSSFSTMVYNGAGTYVKNGSTWSKEQ
jgi:hypothetical protein